MITQINHHTKIGYDANPYLVALLNEAKYRPDSLRNVDCLSRSAFEYVKTHKEELHRWYVGLVGFLSTYGNIWMGNYLNHKPRERFAAGVRGILQQDLSDTTLINCDYKKIPTGKGNVIYCDPPYRIHNYYGIPFDHEEFYDWVRMVSRHNIVLVSEYEMPDDFSCVWQIPVRPRINNGASIRYEKLYIHSA